jgi:hypothetical protein
MLVATLPIETPVETPSAAPVTAADEARPSTEGAWFLMIVAVLLAGGGMFKAFAPAEVVGADAYNYIIAAERGAVLVNAGILCALVGLGAMIYTLISPVTPPAKRPPPMPY